VGSPSLEKGREPRRRCIPKMVFFCPSSATVRESFLNAARPAMRIASLTRLMFLVNQFCPFCSNTILPFTSTAPYWTSHPPIQLQRLGQPVRPSGQQQNRDEDVEKVVHCRAGSRIQRNPRDLREPYSHDSCYDHDSQIAGADRIDQPEQPGSLGRLRIENRLQLRIVRQ
jgi:hypothetical protein